MEVPDCCLCGGDGGEDSPWTQEDHDNVGPKGTGRLMRRMMGNAAVVQGWVYSLCRYAVEKNTKD